MPALCQLPKALAFLNQRATLGKATTAAPAFNVLLVHRPSGLFELVFPQTNAEANQVHAGSGPGEECLLEPKVAGQGAGLRTVAAQLARGKDILLAVDALVKVNAKVKFVWRNNVVGVMVEAVSIKCGVRVQRNYLVLDVVAPKLFKAVKRCVAAVFATAQSRHPSKDRPLIAQL